MVLLPCIVAAFVEPSGSYIALACIAISGIPVFFDDEFRERPGRTMIVLIFSGYIALATVSCILTLIADSFSVIARAHDFPLAGVFPPTDLYHFVAIPSFSLVTILVGGVLLHPRGDIPNLTRQRLTDVALRMVFLLLIIAIILRVLLPPVHWALSARLPLVGFLAFFSVLGLLAITCSVVLAGLVAVVIVWVRAGTVGWLQEKLGQPIDEFLTLLRDLRPIAPAIVGFTFIYAAIVLAFGSLYDALDLWSSGRPGSAPFSGVPSHSTWWDFIHFAITISPPLGNNDIKPTNALTQALVDLELLVGVAWVSIVLAAVTRHIGRSGPNVGEAEQAGATRSNATGSNATPGTQDTVIASRD